MKIDILTGRYTRQGIAALLWLFLTVVAIAQPDGLRAPAAEKALRPLRAIAPPNCAQ